MSGKFIPLGEIVEIKGGGTPDRNVPEYWGGDIPWASVKDIKGFRIEKTSEFITGAGVKNSATNLIKKGSIIVPTRMALGKVSINTIDIAINQDLKALDPKKGWEPRFILWFLSSKSSYIESRGKGATVKGITLDTLRELPVPKLGVAEQRRIAAILDKADSIRRKHQDVITLTDDFLRSTFLGMFGAPIANPKNWRTAPIVEAVASIDAGWSAKGLDRSAASEEMGVLKISAVTSGRYRPDENKAVEIVGAGRVLVIPQKGDLLFSRANTRELVAATCIVDHTVENVFLPDKLWRIRLNNKLATPEYLKFVLSDPVFRSVLCNKATGTSGSMLNISQGKLLDTVLPLPPIDQQKAFSALFWRVEETRSDMMAQSVDTESLFASLSQRAFRGEL